MINRLKEVSVKLQELESDESTFGFLSSDDAILKRELKDELHEIIKDL